MIWLMTLISLHCPMYQDWTTKKKEYECAPVIQFVEFPSQAICESHKKRIFGDLGPYRSKVSITCTSKGT